MPSPLPGMNPYLERAAVWPDFHQTYLVRLRDAIVDELPAAYFMLFRLRPSESHLPKRVRRKVGYLEVQDCKSEEVFTVIELLSPSEKTDGEDRETYLTRRRELLNSGVNFVELDFLRGGPRMPLKDLASCDYYAMVSRPAARPQADIWPLRLRDALPMIPIPPREREPEPVIDLQAVLHHTYDRGQYRRRIYTHDPEPKLAPADAEWAKGLLATAK